MTVTRRQFLKGSAVAAGAAIAFPAIVPSSVFGAKAPSNRITMGCIGMGGKGTGNMRGFKGMSGCEVVAVCDADVKHMAKAGQAAGLTANSCYTDFREVLARDDIDAVSIATPDHWHVLISVAAVRAGMDVFCEKPLTLTIAEGRVLADEVKRYGRVFQTGSQQRSGSEFRFACELVRNGRIGKLHPYTEQRCHYQFRFILDYSGGQMTNWGAHYLDIAQWGNAADDTGPIEIVGSGDFPKTGLFTTAQNENIEYTYANGVKLFLKSGSGHTRFEGTRGWVDVTRGKIDAEPKSILTSKIGPDEIHLYDSNDHKQNFLDCIKSRKDTICTAEIGHRSSSVCHLGNIAMQLGRKLKWDPKTERFINDPAANNMLTRAMRAPWRL